MEDGSLDRAKLAKFLFSPSCPVEVKEEVENIVKPFVNLFYRDKLNYISTCAEGTIVIVEWAQLAEMKMGSWTNHKVIVVESPDRKVFAERRGLTTNDLDERSRFQLLADEKEKILRKAGNGQGTIIRFVNKFVEQREPKDVLLASGPITELHEKVCKIFSL